MRVHLAIIAKYIYLAKEENVEEDLSSELFNICDEEQLSFLTNSRYIIESGINELREFIEFNVNENLTEFVFIFLFKLL